MIKISKNYYIETCYEYKIPFYDLDPLGVVWHGNYVKYLEDARTDLLEKIDCSYSKMSEAGYCWPVVTMEIKYKRPLLMYQHIQIYTRLLEYESCAKIEYHIKDKNTKELLTLAQTIQMAVSTKDLKPCFGSPEMFVESVQSYINKQNRKEDNKKI